MLHETQSFDLAEACKKQGIKLTQKRKNIFSLLTASSVPMSAYDLTDTYKQQFKEAMPAMSVYRILSVLSDAGLVHKLESTNKYLVCSHLQCKHEHRNAQFLICKRCSAAEEVALGSDLHQQIEAGAQKTGFELESMQFELHGTCKKCLEELSN